MLAAISQAQPKVDFTPILRGLLEMALTLWPLWVILGVVGLVRFALDVRAERRFARSGIDEIDRMDGPDFERRLLLLFRDLGYRAQLTKRGADFGADILLRKDGRRIAVQAKRYSKRVGLDAVQEVNGAIGYYKCNRGLVVTNNYFTTAAIELAKSNDVSLWDRDELVKKLLRAQGDEGSEPVLGT